MPSVAPIVDVNVEEIAPEPLVTGDDLLNMGLQQGPVFGKVLDELYYRQLNLELSTRDDALALARQLSKMDQV